MVNSDDSNSSIREKEIDSYPVVFRLYSFEHAQHVDINLVCSIYLKENDVQLVKENNITLINTITYVDGSESEILVPVPAIEHILGDFVGSVFKEDVDDSCSLCSDEAAGPINIYQIMDYALYAHELCMKELSSEFSEFCGECPEIISRNI